MSVDVYALFTGISVGTFWIGYTVGYMRQKKRGDREMAAFVAARLLRKENQVQGQYVDAAMAGQVANALSLGGISGTSLGKR